MFHKLIFLACVSVPWVISAQQTVINLSGKVTTTAGVAIAGAKVALVKSNHSTTTSAAGLYSIKGTDAFSPVSGGARSSVRVVNLNGPVLEFETRAPMTKVTIDLFTPQGRRVGSVLDQNLPPARYSQSLVSGTLSPGLYYARARIGGEESVLRMVALEGVTARAAGVVRRVETALNGTAALAAAVDTLRVSASGFIPKLMPLQTLQGVVNVSLDSAAIAGNHLGGYQHAVTSGGFVPVEWDAGYSMYVATWTLFTTYPGVNSQTGLFGTWMHHQKVVNPPLANMYSDIEGGLGWWRNTRFPTVTPKFIMGGVALNFSQIANGPGAGAGDFVNIRGVYGVAQLSPRLLFPPDGLNIKQGAAGELLGYGYLPLPLTDPKTVTDGVNVKTGNNCWTLFLNTTNFKGPAAFFLPYFFSKASVSNPALSGLFLDSRPSDPNGSIAMETQHVPAAQAKAGNGTTYARIAQLLYPREANGTTVLVHNLCYYKKLALWNAVATWFAGGTPASGVIDTVHRFHRTFSRHEIGWSIWENPISGGVSKKIVVDSLNTPVTDDLYTLVVKWDTTRVKPLKVRARFFNSLPEYLRLKDSLWYPVKPEEVPDNTGLKDYTFPTAASTRAAFTTPTDSASCWKTPGPVAGPFYAYPGDGSKVTYYWYRFADQPAMLNAGMTKQEREIVQARVVKLHQNWKIDRDYLPVPGKNMSLTSIDPALIVTPPAGYEVGYVPIVTRQE